MPIAESITETTDYLADAYTALEEVGATMPKNKNFENLPSTVDTIGAVPVTPPDLSQVLDEAALENLSNIVKQGKAQEYLNLGDQLKVNFNMPGLSYVMPFEVVGFEDAELEDGTTVPAVNLLAYYTSMGTTQWGAAGTTKYSESTLRSYYNGSYTSYLPTVFLACLAPTKVQTYSRSGATDIVYDKLFAPAMAQLGVTDTSYNNASQAAVEGPAFAAYQGSDNAKRLKQAINATGTAQNYWTRTLYSGNSNFFGLVYASGAPDINFYYNSFRVVAACSFAGK